MHEVEYSPIHKRRNVILTEVQLVMGFAVGIKTSIGQLIASAIVWDSHI